jgi:hypothetical protein
MRKYDHGEGLWIDPEGESYSVVEHLIAIQQDPTFFGLSIRNVRHQTVEGLRKIAEKLIVDGWKRYRYLAGDHLFEMLKLDKFLVDSVLTDTQALPSDRVIIETVKPRREYRGTVAQWYDRSMLRSYETNPKRGWRFSR